MSKSAECWLLAASLLGLPVAAFKLDWTPITALGLTGWALVVVFLIKDLDRL